MRLPNTQNSPNVKLSTINKCPRCGKKKLYEENVYNSKSKTKGKEGITICNDCGNDEMLTLRGYGDLEDKKRQQVWENMKL